MTCLYTRNSCLEYSESKFRVVAIVLNVQRAWYSLYDVAAILYILYIQPHCVNFTTGWLKPNNDIIFLFPSFIDMILPHWQFIELFKSISCFYLLWKYWIQINNWWYMCSCCKYFSLTEDHSFAILWIFYLFALLCYTDPRNTKW